ncbi:mariner transposase [Trichonephila clavipes]|nr:mariner transposase [Trichonephila clavipes]
MMDGISICKALAKRNEIKPFLKRMRGEAAQTVAKPGLTSRKVLVCIWWDWKGIIYYELLLWGQTLNSDPCCQQLERLKLATDQKRPELTNRKRVVFHQDIATPHTSVLTRQKLWEHDDDTTYLHLHNLGKELEDREMYSSPPPPVASAATARKTFGPTDSTSTYYVCTRVRSVKSVRRVKVLWYWASNPGFPVRSPML